MKIILLALLFPFVCSAQNIKYKNVLSDGVSDSIAGTSIVLKNHEVIFQKVYTSGLRKEELSSKLNTLLSTTKMFRFNNDVIPMETEFFGRLINYPVDYRKYGGGQWTSLSMLSAPLNASVSIQVKDFKYRVVVSEMYFGRARSAKDSVLSTINLLNGEITQRRSSMFKTNKSAVKLANFISLDLSDKFDLEKSYLSSDF